MIDREKVTAVLHKRFPLASPREIAAAANAIVGLAPEYEPIDASSIGQFRCVSARQRFGLDDVVGGRVCLLRRLEDSVE